MADSILSAVTVHEIAGMYIRGVLLGSSVLTSSEEDPPAAAYQSFPIPVNAPKGLQLHFLYCHAEIVESQQGLQLWPPHYQAVFDPETANLIQLRSVQSKDFKQSHAPDKPMGKCLTLADRMEDEFLTNQVKWYQAYDVILPAFAGLTDKTSKEVKAAAKEFRDLFSQISEEPLRPYYYFVGDEFFALIESLGR